jgi:hypothetical protein
MMMGSLTDFLDRRCNSKHNVGSPFLPALASTLPALARGGIRMRKEAVCIVHCTSVRGLYTEGNRLVQLLVDNNQHNNKDKLLLVPNCITFCAI